MRLYIECDFFPRQMPTYVYFHFGPLAQLAEQLTLNQ